MVNEYCVVIYKHVENDFKLFLVCHLKRNDLVRNKLNRKYILEVKVNEQLHSRIFHKYLHLLFTIIPREIILFIFVTKKSMYYYYPLIVVKNFCFSSDRC